MHTLLELAEQNGGASQRLRDEWAREDERNQLLTRAACHDADAASSERRAAELERAAKEARRMALVNRTLAKECRQAARKVPA